MNIHDTNVKSVPLKIRRKGSMTIELSLLMPGILAVLILVIFMGYFVHDKCVIQRAAYSAVRSYKYSEEANLHQSGAWYMNLFPTYESMTYCEDKAEQRFDEIVNEGLIGKWDISRRAEATDDEIAINVKAQMKCISGMFTRYFSKVLFIVELEEISEIKSGPEYLRERK